MWIITLSLKIISSFFLSYTSWSLPVCTVISGTPLPLSAYGVVIAWGSHSTFYMKTGHRYCKYFILNHMKITETIIQEACDQVFRTINKVNFIHEFHANFLWKTHIFSVLYKITKICVKLNVNRNKAIQNVGIKKCQ